MTSTRLGATGLCTFVRDSIEKFFSTYQDATVVHLEFPSAPPPRAMDLYFELRDIEIRTDVVIIDLGHQWTVFIRPSAIHIGNELSTITVFGDQFVLTPGFMPDGFEPGWVRFRVSSTYPPAVEARDAHGVRLRALQQRLNWRDLGTMSNPYGGVMDTDATRIEAIKQLKYRYWRACDAKDVNGFRSCFIDLGARIDYGQLGTFDDAEPMARLFEQVALHQVDGQYVIFDMHHGFHPDITLTSDTTATGRWTLKFRQVNLLDRTETVMTGEYDDEYVVEEGEWKMSASTLTERWSLRRPLGGDATVHAGIFQG